MANYVASLLSLAGNIHAAKNGNILRHISVLGHGTKVITKLAAGQGPDAATKFCSTVVDQYMKATEGSKIGSAVRGAVHLSRYTDEISATCAMIRAVKSNSPARRFIEESASILGMFVVEGSMMKYAKDIANIKGIKTLNDTMLKHCGKSSGPLQVIPAIVYGVLFSVGSDIGSGLFRKAGSWIADKLGLEKCNDKRPNSDLKPGEPKKYYFG